MPILIPILGAIASVVGSCLPSEEEIRESIKSTNEEVRGEDWVFYNGNK